MAARAIWKGVIRFGQMAVPVKLYSAVEDRNIHFRLLHKKDSQPVRQVMINPDSGSIVPHARARRALQSEQGEWVLFSRQELDRLKPDKSRDIRIRKFLPPEVIDHRWYDRPYYLGPDGSAEQYAALASALQNTQREGLAYWTMRDREYAGALRLFRGYPALMSLRFADQVVSTRALRPPQGKALDKRELEMAGQLIEMLEAAFQPEDYQDAYRARVMELIEKKQRGGRIKRPARRAKEAPDDITAALEASLKAAAHG